MHRTFKLRGPRPELQDLTQSSTTHSGALANPAEAHRAFHRLWGGVPGRRCAPAAAVAGLNESSQLQ